jgi:hypothetical protein
MKTFIRFLIVALTAIPAFVYAAEPRQGEMAGYLFGPAEKVPEEFNGGLFTLCGGVASGGDVSRPQVSNRALRYMDASAIRGRQRARRQVLHGH